MYYQEGDPSVAKERTSIYSTTQKALDAIALHNSLFPETAMRVIGFTRDSDGLLRIVLTQPYIRCLRLAMKEEIDAMVGEKGFRDNWQGQGVNYISDRLALEDLHLANVFIDELTGKPTCIDCIVKFVNPKEIQSLHEKCELYLAGSRFHKGEIESLYLSVRQPLPAPQGEGSGVGSVIS